LPGVEKANELVAFETVAPNGDFLTTSYPDYRDYRDHLASLAGLAATQMSPFSIGPQDHAQKVWGEMVTGNYFAVLGVKASLGRVFSQEEVGEKPSAYPVAVVSSRESKPFSNSAFRRIPPILPAPRTTTRFPEGFITSPPNRQKLQNARVGSPRFEH
jgi:hypothetical protein